ncbi:MAG TPA: hypothetical protein VFE27_24380 [Acidobacteriaceae bacterium]|jgi:hypothetical protein|nr:hypothetical protein [Acidobacteriaceae bacterium]
MATLAGAVNGAANIEESDVELQEPGLDPRYTDDGAVQLVIQDMQRAKTYLDQKQWNLHWREADVLYQSPRTNQSFEGSTVARANISRFTVAKHVNSLVPAMKSGIFYETPPFLLRPRPATSQTTARAKTTLYGALLDDCDFESESELALEDMTNFGSVIVKAGWTTETKTKKVRSPKQAPITQQLPFGGKLTIHTKESDERVVTDTEVTTEGLFFERCELGSVFVDPTWKKPNALHKSAKYVIHLTYPTYKDLDRMREEKVLDEDGKQIGGYDIPSEEELKNYFFAHRDQNAANPSQVMLNLGGQNYAIHHAQNDDEVSSADPLEAPIAMMERTDPTYVYAILTTDGINGLLIKKEEHGFPFLNYFAANFWNIPKAGYGIGVGRLAGSDQRIEKGLVDAVLDLLSMAINPMYARDRGANAPTQQIRMRLGGIVDVDTKPGQSVRDAFGIIETPKTPPEVFSVLQAAAQNAQSTTGADEAFTQGSLPGKGGSSAARTATGAGGIIAANAGKIQGPVGHFVKGILLPFIQLIDFLVKDRMSPSKIREILGRELGDAFELDAQNFYESEDMFDCLAGAKLAAKKAMAQALPLMVQIFENQPLVQQLNATGYMVDVKLLLEMFMEVSEWKDARELIRPMTPQEQQKYAQNNPGLQRVQGQIAAIGARHNAKSAEIDQSKEADLAKDLMGKASDEAALWDERKWDRTAIEQSEFAPAGG